MIINILFHINSSLWVVTIPIIIIFILLFFILIQKKRIQKFKTLLSNNYNNENQIYELLEIGSWKYNVNNNKINISQLASSMLGLSKHFFSREEILELINIDNKEEVTELIDTAINNKDKTFSCSLVLNQNDSKKYYSVKSIINYNSKSVELVGTISDITDYKITNNNFKKLQIAVDKGANSVIITNTKGEIEYVNKKFEEISGYSIEEVFGKSPNIIKSGIQDNSVYDNLWKTIKTGAIWKGELCNKSKDEKLYWEIVSIVPIVDENSQIISYVAIKEDITSLKKAQHELIENKKKLEEAQKIGKIGNWEYNITTDEIICSDEVYRIYEIEKQKLDFNIISKYHNPKDNQKLTAMTNVAIQHGIKSLELLLNLKFELELNKYAILNIELEYNNDRSLKKIHGTIQDVTKQHIIELELEKAKQKAQESDRLKTSFLANLSHEIRTPMNGIVGFAEILKDSDLTSEKREYYTKIIIDNSSHLLNIVNDILDISKIDAGQVEVKLTSVNLNSLITELCQTNELEAKEQNTVISKIDIDDNYNFIVTDEIKLKQILNNLLNNSIKFTSNGNVDIKSYYFDGKIVISVSDTGIGIEKEKLSEIFDQFKQVELGYTRKYGGTGLGLALCKGYLNSMGGNISVKSEIGKGSEFIIEIPYVKAVLDKQKTENTVNKKMFEGRTVLLVEDEEVNMTYLKVLSKSLGLNFILAYDGITAISKCKEHQEIDIVLMDIKLPGIDGKEATKRIRKIRPNLPIIAQTAFAMLNDKEIILEAGCNDYITKPIQKAVFVEILSKYL
jgi:PAS domain S-box-containing protein